MGDGAFADLRGGTRVAVLDAGGTVLAMTQLDAGRLTSSTCMLYFELKAVPAGHGRYELQVGDRPPYEYTEDSMHRPKGIGVE
ncbi:hypothetical protein ACQP2P_40180 [Dactylosporangium sp. CA-139114]|uniref:hypothetical protein n=1 Tax=Dactylosporangium sp. CA-139114 TaxID=3239931 RepID=UPI003D973E2F